MFNFIYSFITFIIALFLTALGFLAILTSLFEHIRTTFSMFVLNNALFLFLFGLCLFVSGLAFACYILLSCKRKYVIIHSGSREVSISETLIREYLKIYWKQIFPSQEIPVRLLLNKNKIKIAANLPSTPYEEQKNLLQRIEKDISDLFRDILGYREDIELAISFENTTP
ncbi:Uncharacterized protein PHSC3_001409 [Chlamydiales bacterium STE3]|nr:Uncharacterized protein PHSC3_001409 [Chlamydiales bacterium STE3]